MIGGAKCLEIFPKVLLTKHGIGLVVSANAHEALTGTLVDVTNSFINTDEEKGTTNIAGKPTI